MPMDHETRPYDFTSNKNPWQIKLGYPKFRLMRAIFYFFIFFPFSLSLSFSLFPLSSCPSSFFLDSFDRFPSLSSNFLYFPSIFFRPRDRSSRVEIRLTFEVANGWRKSDNSVITGNRNFQRRMSVIMKNKWKFRSSLDPERF